MLIITMMVIIIIMIIMISIEIIIMKNMLNAIFFISSVDIFLMI